MEHSVDDELLAICREIKQDNRPVDAWAEIEASDWFQTPHYCGGFDATDMHFAFTVRTAAGDCCFSLSLEQALLVADGRITIISSQMSPWRNDNDFN